MSSSRSNRRTGRSPSISTSWDPVAKWYSGWVGKRGSIYHRRAAIPTVLEFGRFERGESVLDVGCGQGVLAPHVLSLGASYVGVDASRRLLATARRFHGERARFRLADSRRLHEEHALANGCFDAAVFMLSLQDMDPLEEVVESVAKVLKPTGRIVIFMTHPCFRVPRGSGWGHDRSRKLSYRRVERYLREARVPMKVFSEVSRNSRGATISFHRPLAAYINTLARHGFSTDRLAEIADPLAGEVGRSPQDDIPLFVALRARRSPPPEGATG